MRDYLEALLDTVKMGAPESAGDGVCDCALY